MYPRFPRSGRSARDRQAGEEKKAHDNLDSFASSSGLLSPPCPPCIPVTYRNLGRIPGQPFSSCIVAHASVCSCNWAGNCGAGDTNTCCMDRSPWSLFVPPCSGEANLEPGVYFARRIRQSACSGQKLDFTSLNSSSVVFMGVWSIEDVSLHLGRLGL